jgi:hypothetical protein
VGVDRRAKATPEEEASNYSQAVRTNTARQEMVKTRKGRIMQVIREEQREAPDAARSTNPLEG